ncbi:MAG: YihY family inner membrane protein [Alcanivorax sp.]|nr:YihY family inner membrane protein [Thalassolituus oleivorans]
MKPRLNLKWRRTAQIIWSTLTRFESMERRRDAAALTYTTLFALVPVLTVSYSILSALPALQSWGEQANAQLFAYVMPEGSEVISEYLQQFSQQARKLTWVGLVFLFITAFMLLQTVETQFNRIWNVQTSRSKIQTFFRYWAVLSLGPLFFGAAFATTSIVASLPLWGGDLATSVEFIAHLLPWALSSIAIALLYIVVPNCKVPVLHAFIASTVIATVFELAKFLFSETLGMFPSYKLIYGAFAAVPLFLLWMYASWMLLLLGAELTFSLSHHRAAKKNGNSALERLRVAATLYEAQQKGGLLTEDRLRKGLDDIGAERISAILSDFQQQRWATISHEQEWTWLRDPRSLTLAEFFAHEPLKAMSQIEGSGSVSNDPLKQRWVAWQQDWQNTITDDSGRSLDSLFQ